MWQHFLSSKVKIQWLKLKIQHYKYSGIQQSSKLEPAVQRQVIPSDSGILCSKKPPLLASWHCMSALQHQPQTSQRSHAQKIGEMIEVPPKMHLCVCSEDLAQESGKAFMMVS